MPKRAQSSEIYIVCRHRVTVCCNHYTLNFFLVVMYLHCIRQNQRRVNHVGFGFNLYKGRVFSNHRQARLLQAT